MRDRQVRFTDTAYLHTVYFHCKHFILFLSRSDPTVALSTALSWIACSRLRDGPLNWASANSKLKQKETGKSRGEKALCPFLFPFSRPNNFSRAFYFRVFPTIWDPGTSLRVAAPSPRQRKNGWEGAGTRRLAWNRLFHEVFFFPLYKFHFLGFVIQSFVVPWYIHVDKTCVRDCFLRPSLIRTQWHVPLVSVVTGFHCILNHEIVLKKRKTISNEVCKEIEINKLKSGVLIMSVFLVSR